MAVTIKNSHWPQLNFSDYGDTLATVQLWTQIVGKIRLRKSPWLNHSWHVSLYISARGLTTNSIPYDGGCFDIEFDFVSHLLVVRNSAGQTGTIELRSLSVAGFYEHLMKLLPEMGIDVEIYAKPNEVDPAIPFAEDETHKTYDGAAMNKLWQAMVNVNNVFKRFRAGFSGKCSPEHIFWGAFDLAVTRFSGRTAPLHPGGAPNMPVRVMQEAYSHEVSSCGFWPGSADSPHAIFYSYCYPTLDAFSKQIVEPSQAGFNADLGEFVLPYDAIRSAKDPEAVLLRFLQTTYEAAAHTGNWDRPAMEADLTIYER
ncbi:DUF5996 family protein [Mucilaginibacter ginkgonis]|uniref:Ava_C0101 and related proteins n=1 Tax=Mucilaginibacter ginkgonis TaxID=2682091 RepID=A0A6I4IPD9_9SPHI|nr:DUF5996 family protein [Mucilaginibacter ginkgonis]QQL50801.1 hypothetical protein GO620_004910 [Mucilaginibacter ginkgonis]